DNFKLQKLKTAPSILLTAHFHNWELMGAWMGRHGVPLLGGARPLSAPWAQSILVRLRSRLGMQIAFQALPRRALAHLQTGGCFGFLWDQRVAMRPAPSKAFFASFFGTPLALDPLPFFLLRHKPVPVFFGA